MSHDISQPVPQGGDGAQDAENSRIAAIANELERLCAVHEAQLGDSQADVLAVKDRHLGYSSRHTQVSVPATKAGQSL